MSRIGRVPVELPEKVEVNISGNQIKVKGPLGQLDFTSHNLVKVEKKDKQVVVTPADQTKKSHSLWGTTRTLLQNMVTGVATGFQRDLEFNGVGYKVVVKGDVLVLNLGYSHPIDYNLPSGVKVAVKGSTISLTGIDKELLGRVAAKIRSFRPPEPYKGKGVKYKEEVIIRKAGKTGAKK